jgi:glycosyltransferase involved in cell wall biosynthesis
VKLTGVSPDKVVVAYPGVSEVTEQAVERSAKAAPYLLAVSTLYGFKNHERLIEAFAILRAADHTRHRLRIIGGDADVSAAYLRRVAEELGVADFVDLLGPVAHDSLASHYAGASLLVYPSEYETFGQPPLEAMALGCPVVAANSSALPEILGDSAEMVDPEDVESIAGGMAKVLDDRATRTALVERGYSRVRRFSWSASAETIALLLLGGG